MRKSGILLPVSSIPSPYGIGTFSKQAYGFVDFLEKAGQKLWQILPLGPTGYGDSPYQSFSTFAGNPYYIDLESLVADGYLTVEECKSCDFGSDRQSIDYEKIYLSRFRILWKAYERSHVEKNASFQTFIKENQEWLDDYALYMAVKDSFDGAGWMEWEEDIKFRKPQAIDKYRQTYAKEINFYRFQQFLFAKQWKALKQYANGKGIEIIGDIPIYVALDSADTWAHPELFQLDETRIPLKVAGCPPDAFSASGQLWGNPLYQWSYHEKTGYAWWIRRIACCYEWYDIVRIDHFRGFDEYYAIPYGDATAEFGQWEKGPGIALFQAIRKQLGEIRVIAEDLGYLTESVKQLVTDTGYPGMKVLQFAFDAGVESDYLPHNYNKNCVVYTGTHDNDTLVGWYKNMRTEDKKFAKRYLDIQSEQEIAWTFIRAALSSVADTAIIPIQDYLELDTKARINLPSTLGENWKWRLVEGQCGDALAERIRQMTRLYAR